MGAKENQTISDWTLWLLAAVLFLLPMWRVGYYDVGMFLDDGSQGVSEVLKLGV